VKNKIIDIVKKQGINYSCSMNKENENNGREPGGGA